MSDNLNIYSPNEITLVLTRSDGLSHIVGGYSEDAMLSVEPAAEAFTLYTSADNKSTLMFNPNNSATVMITLNQTSASNDILSSLYEEFRQSKSPSKLFSVMIKDLNGRSLYECAQAFIGKRPTASFANSMQNREWTLLCPDMRQYSGGNSKFSPADQAAVELLGGTVEDRWSSN